LLTLPVKPRLIAVDTLARSFGSGNENDAKDMNAFVAACDHIASRLDAFVLVVHHAGKDTERGARGSSVLRAAADVEISVKRGLGDMSAIVRVTKQKDAEEGRPISVRLVHAECVHAATGEVITSLVPVVSEASDEADDTPRDPGRLGKNERAILEILDEGPARYGTLKARLGLSDNEKRGLTKALKSLVEKGLAVKNEDDLYELQGPFGDNA
ncbi:MAG: AAA family ATPase, partial [Planctomycetia bacterium]